MFNEGRKHSYQTQPSLDIRGRDEKEHPSGLYKHAHTRHRILGVPFSSVLNTIAQFPESSLFAVVALLLLLSVLVKTDQRGLLD